jgi:hypothetical protein
MSIQLNSNLELIQIIYPQNTKVYLLKTAYWDVSIKKEVKDTFGKLKFDLSSYGLPTDYLETDSLPLFNGNVFNVLIKQINLSASYDSGSGGQLPYQYSLRVTSVDNDEIVFDFVFKHIGTLCCRKT